MPWDNSPEKRRRDARVYQDPEYVRNRELARQRAGGRCECQGDCGRHQGPCGRRDRRLQCDHDTPVSRGGGHELANLRMLGAGDGTCKCHERKTAQEGGGFRNPKGDPEPSPRTAW